MTEQNTNENVDQTTEQSGDNAGENATVTTTEKVEEKVFKQEDVNNIVAKESKKATEKLLKELGIEDFENAKDGLTKFKEWQDSQKTEQEKQAERLKQLEDNYNQATSEKENLQAQLSALKAGVVAESVEDVVVLAKNLVSDEVDMDEAIKQVIEKYPHFAQKEEKEEEKPNFTTGQHHSEGMKKNDPFMAKLAKYKT